MTIGGSAESTVLIHSARIRHFDPFGVAQGGLREKSRGVHAVIGDLREGQGQRRESSREQPRAGMTASEMRRNDDPMNRAIPFHVAG